jgi:hypothetical protein
MTTLLSAAVAAVTALLVAPWAATWERRREARRQREQINREFLHPLRLHLAEVHFRLAEIADRLKRERGVCKALDVVGEAKEVSQQPADWFNGWGCYLAGVCYLTARLFYYVQKVKESLPYVQLKRGDDTQLLALITRMEIAFSRNLGVYYITQLSVGQLIAEERQPGFISYRGFCELLQNPAEIIWLDRVVDFYLQIARGQRPEAIPEVLSSVFDLSDFLDREVKGGASLSSRYRAEGVPLPL